MFDFTRLRAKRKGLLRINDSPIVKEQGLVMCPGGKNRIGCVAPNPEMPCVDAGDDRVNQHTGLVAIHSVGKEKRSLCHFISNTKTNMWQHDKNDMKTEVCVSSFYSAVFA